jgi:hypothetical protein
MTGGEGALPISGGPIVELDAPRRGLSFVSPAVAGTPVTAEVVGRAGDRAHVVVSGAPDFVYDPRVAGVWAVAREGLGPAESVEIGAEGHAAFELKLPDLRAGEQAAIHHVQLLVVDAQGAAVLGTPRVLVLLDPSI